MLGELWRIMVTHQRQPLWLFHKSEGSFDRNSGYWDRTRCSVMPVAANVWFYGAQENVRGVRADLGTE